MPVASLVELLCAVKVRSVAIVAPGPTIVSLPAIADYDLAVFVGDSFKRTSQRAKRNFYVRANTEYPDLTNLDHQEDLRDFEGELLLASSVMESEQSVESLALAGLPQKNVYLFDQRHFGGESCTPEQTCCQHKLEITIQEMVALKSGLPHHYSEGATVLLHALATGLLLDATQIDVYGADLPLRRIDYKYGGPDPAQSMRRSSLFQLTRKIKMAFDLEFRDLIRIAKEKAGESLLGDKAPSLFAHDYVELVADFQYLADCAALQGCEIRAHGKKSQLLRISGIGPLGLEVN